MDSVEENSSSLETEKWRMVPDSSRFQVSNWGNVRDLDDISEVGGKFEFWVEDGLAMVWISELEMGYRGALWKLMLMTWYKGILLDLRMEFKDGNGQNCRIDNLRPLMQDAKSGLYRPMRVRPAGDQWILDRRMGLRIQIIETGEVFESARACAEHIGGLPSRISEVLAGTQKSHRGFTFRRLDD